MELMELPSKVDVPRMDSPLAWLRNQREVLRQEMSFYFRPRADSPLGSSSKNDDLQQMAPTFSGIGAACFWKGEAGEKLTASVFKEINEFLHPDLPSIRCVGGTRFNSDQISDPEWEAFGSFVFFIPAVEYLEFSAGKNILACTVAWKQQEEMNEDRQWMSIPTHLIASTERVKSILNRISQIPTPSVLNPTTEQTLASKRNSLSEFDWKKLVSEITRQLTKATPSEFTGDSVLEVNNLKQEYLDGGQEGLDALLMRIYTSMETEWEQADLERELLKVVLARRTDLEGDIDDPYGLLQQIQTPDSQSYQYSLGMPGGSVFIGSTPERLYRRQGKKVITEAIAGSRPRGPTGDVHKDFMIGLEMMTCPKEYIEFSLVRDWVKQVLQSLCSDVHMDVPVGIKRTVSLQHLYSRLRGELKGTPSDWEILNVFHPTPAVCGRPQSLAKEKLAEMESFDRGYYAGPIGWMAGDSSEFIVAIRSGLMRENEEGQPMDISLYAGVGVVSDSVAESEWKELEMKINPFIRLLAPKPSPIAAQDVNSRAAMLVIEELVRCGVDTFVISPGSRSSPLVYAAASHVHCTVVTCIDERSLAFWGLGWGRATSKPAALITSSGTAVANLLPAVVEANHSHIALLVISADRPSVLRHTCANQTIDQVHIFGRNTRYFHDIPPPSASNTAMELRGLLTMVDGAVRYATSTPAGPVHLNFQFNFPAMPLKEGETASLDPLLTHWWTSAKPFTTSIPNPLTAPVSNHAALAQASRPSTYSLDAKESI